MTRPHESEQSPTDGASPAAPAPAAPENAESGSHSAQAAPPRPSRVRKVTTKTLHQFTDTKQLVTVMMDAIKCESTLVLDHPIIHQRQRLERKRELTTPRPHGPHQPTERYTKSAAFSTETSTTTPSSSSSTPTARLRVRSLTTTFLSTSLLSARSTIPTNPRPPASVRTIIVRATISYAGALSIAKDCALPFD